MKHDAVLHEGRAAPEARAVRRIGILRFALGMAQMGAAVFAGVLLVCTGVGPVTLTAAAVASSLTLLSLALAHVVPGWRRG